MGQMRVARHSNVGNSCKSYANQAHNNAHQCVINAPLKLLHCCKRVHALQCACFPLSEVAKLIFYGNYNYYYC